MSDDRTEEPTAKKREKFREDGRVPMSRDVGAVALCAVVLVGATVFGAPIAREAFGLMVRSIRRIGEVNGDPQGILSQANADAGAAIGVVALGGCMVLLACAAAIGVAQTGGLWSGKLVGFKLDRLGLLKGLKRAFASGEAFSQLGLTIAKAIAIGTVLWIVLAEEIDRLPGLLNVAPDVALETIGELLMRIATAALLVTAVLAATEYFLSLRRVGAQLRMTKQEVKDELKQSEGDPLVRQRMRARMRQIGRNRMLAAVRTASVVIVNPTHYAVALVYDPKTGGAPKLVAKGIDHLAAKIREEARKHQIPIVANPPVARAIHAAGKLGREIPAELFEVVARVLAYVYRMTRWRNAA